MANIDFNLIAKQLQDYLKHMPNDEIYAWSALTFGVVLVLAALILM